MKSFGHLKETPNKLLLENYIKLQVFTWFFLIGHFDPLVLFVLFALSLDTLTLAPKQEKLHRSM